MKRVLDLFASSLMLVILSPPLLILAIWIKCDSVGPVFYRGWRLGRLGEPFRIFKFRSMVVDAERRGGPSTGKNDARITRVGHVLRRYKLDELPQLLNVFNGDMSLVGPRPEVLQEAEAYRDEFAKILELRPGITDWASIWNSDEGTVLANFEDPHAAYRTHLQGTKLLLQLEYSRTAGVRTDGRILYATIRHLVDRRWMPSELLGYPTPLELCRGPRAGAAHDGAA